MGEVLFDVLPFLAFVGLSVNSFGLFLKGCLKHFLVFTTFFLGCLRVDLSLFGLAVRSDYFALFSAHLDGALLLSVLEGRLSSGCLFIKGQACKLLLELVDDFFILLNSQLTLANLP